MSTFTIRTDLLYRLRWLVAGWAPVGAVYFLFAAIQPEGSMLQPSWLDRKLPYVQWAIWPYLSFFILLPLAYWKCEIEKVRWLTRSMQTVLLLSAIVYLLWPTAMQPEAVNPATFSGWVLQILMFIDTNGNCLPSLHASLSLLAVLALLQPGRFAAANILLWIWFAAISLSIVMLRRHLAIDWAAGVATALAAGWCCRQILLYRQKQL